MYHTHKKPRSHPHHAPPPPAPPVDPSYPYHQPYPSSSLSLPSCPHCTSPPTSFRTDATSGDLLCTSCGAVLDSRLRDPRAEWRDFQSVDDLARGNLPGRRARCGDVGVDESRWVGGLMPTSLSSGVFGGGIAVGAAGGGSGGGAGSKEERWKLAGMRRNLKRTMAKIEHATMMEEKRKMQEALLEGEARQAKLRRGEDVEGGEGGLEVEGDYEGLMARRNLEAGRESQSREEDASANPEQQRQTQRQQLQQQQQFMALKDKKWSLTEAILLHGTLHQVQQFVHIHHRNATAIANASPDSFDFYDTSSKNNYADANADEWTQSTHEIERHHLHKKLDASTRSSTQKLYVAFTLLSHASQTLQLGTVVLRRATEGLIRFAERRDGLRVKGVSIGGNAVAKLLAEKDGVITLSLMPWYHVGGPSSSSSSSKSTSTSSSKSSQTSTPSSIATDLQRIRQYASLDAAILYLSAKHAGLGRTLAEVCSAFGTFGTVRHGNTTTALTKDVEDAEPLVRPKHCSKAMQELRAVVPEMVVLPRANGNGAVFNTSSLSSSLDGTLGAVPVPVEMESSGSKEGIIDNDDGKPEVLASASSQSIAFADAIKSGSTSSPAVDVKREPTPPTTFPDIPTSSSSCNDINYTGNSGSDSNGTITSVNNTEEAALSDLTARMARSLQLPATATTAAIVVAVRCARDAATSQASLSGISSTASRKGGGSTGTSSTVRRRANKRSYSALRRGGKNGMFAERNGGKNGHPQGVAKLQDTPETIAISSLLLVCMAGGIMQRLAR